MQLNILLNVISYLKQINIEKKYIELLKMVELPVNFTDNIIYKQQILEYGLTQEILQLVEFSFYYTMRENIHILTNIIYIMKKKYNNIFRLYKILKVLFNIPLILNILYENIISMEINTNYVITNNNIIEPFIIYRNLHIVEINTNELDLFNIIIPIENIEGNSLYIDEKDLYIIDKHILTVQLNMKYDLEITLWNKLILTTDPVLFNIIINIGLYNHNFDIQSRLYQNINNELNFILYGTVNSYVKYWLYEKNDNIPLKIDYTNSIFDNCCVCYEDKILPLLKTCQHYIICKDCISILYNKHNKRSCPICRMFF